MLLEAFGHDLLYLILGAVWAIKLLRDRLIYVLLLIIHSTLELIPYLNRLFDLLWPYFAILVINFEHSFIPGVCDMFVILLKPALLILFVAIGTPCWHLCLYFLRASCIIGEITGTYFNWTDFSTGWFWILRHIDKWLALFIGGVSISSCPSLYIA